LGEEANVQVNNYTTAIDFTVQNFLIGDAKSNSYPDLTLPLGQQLGRENNITNQQIFGTKKGERRK